MAKKVLMEEMTWVEIKEAIEGGRTGVIVVSGAMEQHGPHLPTGTDTILGYELAQRAAVQLDNVLVAPVVRPCLSEHHIGFPGSFTLSWKTYYDVLEDYCESLSQNGFTDIFLASSHGGNTAVMTAITPDIAKKLYGRTNVHLIDYHAFSAGDTSELLQKQGISKAKAGVHSGYSETSLMLVAKPHLVKMELAEKGLDDDAFYEPENIPRSQINCFIHGIKPYSDNGILGDPRGANREVGEALMEITVNAFAEAISGALDS